MDKRYRLFLCTFLEWGSAQCQCLQAALAVGRAGVRGQLQRRQTQAIVDAQAVGLQHPGCQARDAGFMVGQGGMGQVQPQLVALGLLRVAADEVVRARGQRFGGFLPDHQLERVATPVGAYAVELGLKI